MIMAPDLEEMFEKLDLVFQNCDQQAGIELLQRYLEQKKKQEVPRMEEEDDDEEAEATTEEDLYGGCDDENGREINNNSGSNCNSNGYLSMSPSSISSTSLSTCSTVPFGGAFNGNNTSDSIIAIKNSNSCLFHQDIGNCFNANTSIKPVAIISNRLGGDDASKLIPSISSLTTITDPAAMTSKPEVGMIVVDASNLFIPFQQSMASKHNFLTVCDERARVDIKAFVKHIKSQFPTVDKWKVVWVVVDFQDQRMKHMIDFMKRDYEVVTRSSFRNFSGKEKSADNKACVVLTSHFYEHSPRSPTVLVSGDGDFLSLIEFYAQKERQIQIMSFNHAISSRIQDLEKLHPRSVKVMSLDKVIEDGRCYFYETSFDLHRSTTKGKYNEANNIIVFQTSRRYYNQMRRVDRFLTEVALEASKYWRVPVRVSWALDEAKYAGSAFLSFVITHAERGNPPYSASLPTDKRPVVDLFNVEKDFVNSRSIQDVFNNILQVPEEDRYAYFHAKNCVKDRDLCELLNIEESESLSTTTTGTASSSEDTVWNSNEDYTYDTSSLDEYSKPSSSSGAAAATTTTKCAWGFRCKNGVRCGYGHSKFELQYFVENGGTGNPRYKSSMCSKYIKSQCSLQSHLCNYAHGRQEIQ